MKRTLGILGLPFVLVAGCGDTSNPEGEQATAINERIAVSKLELSSSDEPYLLHPLRVTIEAELSGEAYETDLLIGMRTSDGQAGCVLGAMPVAHSGDASLYANEAEFVVDRTCYELVGSEDIELFASFDPWDKLGDREPVEIDTASPAGLDLYSIVAAAALSVEGCESCETYYTLNGTPGLDAQLRELNLSSVVTMLPVAAAGGEEPVGPNRPDFSLTSRSRITGLPKGEGLPESKHVQLSHRIRPLGSTDEGLPLLQGNPARPVELMTLEVPSHGDITVASALYLEGAARETIVDGAWSNIEEFELVTCLQTDFDQAIYVGEDQPRVDDCGAVPVVVARQEVGEDGLPLPNPGAATARSAEVWGDSWGSNAGYGFGYSGVTFETWLDVNATDSNATTYKGIEVSSAGSWFEAGVYAGGTVFDNVVDIVDIYATFIGYDFGGGGVAMGASIFIYEFIPEFEIQLSDGNPVSLQDILDAANLDIETSITKSVSLIGVSFDDGCGSVNAGLWLEGTLGIDAEQTTITASTTSQGVEVSGTITPFMNIAAKAGVTVAYSEYVSGGIIATLNLLNIDVPFTVAVEVIDYSPLDAMRLTFNEYAFAFLTVLSGNVMFSIEWDMGSWCVIDSLCRGDHTHIIASWNGWNFPIPLFDLEQTLDVGDDKPANAFCGSNTELHAGDFNGDSATDYLCQNNSNGYKSIDYQSNGSFGGTDWVSYVNWCSGSGQLLVGDFDGDERDDVLCHTSTSKLVDFADSNGQLLGTDWSATSSFCTGSDTVLRTGDYNNDGRDDLYCYERAGDKWLDFADSSGHFGGADWSGTELPTTFCDLYDGKTIALQTSHGRYLRAGNSSESWVVNQSTSIGSWEQFVVVCSGEDVALKTAHNRYVQANSSSSDWLVKQQTSIGSWEKFDAVAQDGSWALLSYHNRYLQARDANSNWVVKQQTSIGTWEKFVVIEQ